jgi:glycosyltransferase involved in cell wall biosynthesis
MKVLWASLVEFPPLSLALGKTPPAHCGWLYASAKSVLQLMPELELGVLVYSYGREYKMCNIDGISYYLIPSRDMTKASKQQIAACRRAIADFRPDLIHIHGTEHSLAEAVCRANEGGCRMVANIQGLAGPYARYADGGLSLRDKLTNITPLDFYRGTFLLNAKRSFRHRARCEEYVIRHIQHIVGRTEWDYSHALAINSEISYHFMNETLRDSFYTEPKWSLERCQRHTIFVSNSGAPLKGAHQVLKALPLVLRRYPDTVVRFCGSSVLSNDWHTLIRMQGYHLYLRRLVKKLNLQEHVQFVGSLSEDRMKQSFLNAHLYLMPSAIENSSNSLCEAQLLGVPTIAAYVGGTSTLVEDKMTGYLYRYEEHEMLANIITKLFAATDIEQLSAREMQVASLRHDRHANALRLAEIYQTIIRE